MSLNQTQSNLNDSVHSGSSNTDISSDGCQFDTNNSANTDLINNDDFLIGYQNEIRNLIYYYENHHMFELDIWDFYLTNYNLFEFIQSNLEKMNEFVEDYFKKYQIKNDKALNLWTELKEFLQNHFEDNNESTEKKVAMLGFQKFLKCLVNEDLANKNGIQHFNLKRISDKSDYLFRSKEEVAGIFIIFLIDAPAFVVLFDEKLPVIELKIYLLEIKHTIFDNEVGYVFSRKNSVQHFESISNIQQQTLTGKMTAEPSHIQDNLNCSSNELSIENTEQPVEVPSNVREPSLELTKISSKIKKKLSESQQLSLKTNETQSDPINFQQNRSSPRLEEASDNHEELQDDEMKKLTVKPLLKESYCEHIRSIINLNENKIYRRMKFVILNQPSIYIVMFKFLMSFLSVIDITLDIFLTFKFFQSGQTLYGIFTIGILIVVGLLNVIFERNTLKKFQNQSVYLPGPLNFVTLRYFCSFCQLSAFLMTLKATILSIKTRKEQRLVILLKNIFQYGNGDFYFDSQNLKYMETYLEAIPQTTLQVYIILATQKWSWLQLLSIVSGVANINFAALNWDAFLNRVHLLGLFRDPFAILRTFCYNGFLITSHSLLFWQFHWIFGISSILLHILITCFSKLNKKDATLIFLNYNFKNTDYENFINKLTIVINFVLLCIFCLNRPSGSSKDAFHMGVFVCQIVFFTFWSVSVALNKFEFQLNVMFMPFHMRIF